MHKQAALDNGRGYALVQIFICSGFEDVNHTGLFIELHYIAVGVEVLDVITYAF